MRDHFTPVEEHNHILYLVALIFAAEAIFGTWRAIKLYIYIGLSPFSKQAVSCFFWGRASGYGQ